ncbi:MAG: hypothetical protein KDD82_20845 [Planctomycetes bacterium]|nr:hypothetical protein [Planctomycetota bacterium]
MSRKRVGGGGPSLAERCARVSLRFDDWLVPEAWSVGYYTPLWESLSEEERLACNHWVYCLHYNKIIRGEGMAVVANCLIADAVEPQAPHVAALLRHEAEEERDHIAAFGRTLGAIYARYGVDPRYTGEKRGHRYVRNRPVVGWLIRTFGVDFLTTYFTGRGIANHLGKGYELPLCTFRTGNAQVQELSLLHTQDESHHMAASHLIAAASPDCLPVHRRSAVNRAGARAVIRATAVMTFSEAIVERVHREATLGAFCSMRAFDGRSTGFLRELVGGHFAQPTGVQRSINAQLARPTQRLLEGAALEPEDRALWEQTLIKNQGHLRFLG